MKKRNTKSSYHTNRDMNQDTYKLRRKVINFVYEAKDLIPTLPRIEVRITDCDRHEVLGTASMGNCVIWIPAKTLKMSANDQRQIVFHELLHAAYGVKHIDSCPLMGPYFKKMTKSQTDKLFVKYATKVA